MLIYGAKNLKEIYEKGDDFTISIKPQVIVKYPNSKQNFFYFDQCEDVLTVYVNKNSLEEAEDLFKNFKEEVIVNFTQELNANKFLALKSKDVLNKIINVEYIKEVQLVCTFESIKTRV